MFDMLVQDTQFTMEANLSLRQGKTMDKQQANIL
jgi:hypothetical protein